uniref:Uncharacterized protein n=1 Tax=Arundo donax TaxID=35708 RepID=A0A0A8ZA96_ARUDO
MRPQSWYCGSHDATTLPGWRS